MYFMTSAKELYILAKEAENNRNWLQAIRYFDELYRKIQNPKLLFSLGYLSSRIPDHEKAIHYYTQYITYHSDDPVAHYNLGVEYFHLQEFTKSIFHLKKTLELQDNFLRSLLLLGYIHEILSLPDEAKKYFEQALRINPDSKIAIQGLLVSLLKLNCGEEALSLCEKYLQKFPGDTMLRNLKIQILIQLRKTETLYRELSELTEQKESYKSFDAYIQKIQNNQETSDDYREFLENLHQKMEIKLQESEKENDKKTYLDLSILSLFSGNKEQAIRYLTRALGDPEDKEK